MEQTKTYNIKELWSKCCAFDSVPTDSKFVIFSANNPFVREYNEAVRHLIKAIKPSSL